MEKNEAYLAFIKSVLHRYRPVSEASIASLFALAEIQSIAQGEILLPIGNTAKDIYLLYQGVVVSYYLNTEGRVYHKNIFLEGHFVASTVSALTNQASHFGLKAIEDSILVRFNYQKYRQLIEQHQDLKDFYIAYLEKNWVIDKEKREVEIVLAEAGERYLNFISTHPHIEDRVPLHYIASHLGITPTQLSRIRKKMK